MDLSKISVGKNPPDEIHSVIENGKGGNPVKYEIDKDSGAVVVDRFLHTAMRYPGNYGFIPHTLSEDGDPVDILVLGDTPVIPTAVMRVRPIGVLIMEDEQGKDEKIIAVPVDELMPDHENIHSISDLSKIERDRIEHFFQHYKDLEPGKTVKIDRWGDVDEAKKMITEGIQREKDAKAALAAGGAPAVKKPEAAGEETKPSSGGGAKPAFDSRKRPPPRSI
ncbi:MAG: inorganic diphosphatase [Micavibrio sp.]|nr:MAG: inorganic diphosphatase [Micavibrio sp.]